MTGDHTREQEGLQMHTSYSQRLLQDHFRATQRPEHKLIQWTDGPFPEIPPVVAAAAAEAATTDNASEPSASSATSHF
jgi:hypothetical protein